ncbi:MAG TPA: 2-hydroxychromene-2-carboxylate isomerase [Candidatus Tumulicola sp.]|nr:2-hydroxychromene-2-carboxylate isomerase [Candidatus Tumulicola sp.]
MTGAPVLEFWFDFASTYSYVAASRIETLCRDAAVALRWKPFMLGPIFEMQGWRTSPFVVNPLRGGYMWRDLERLTAKYGLPWKKPSAFPRTAALAAKVAAAHDGEPWLGDFVRTAFAAAFGRDADLNDRRVVASLLAAAGTDSENALRIATETPRKSELRNNTERAMSLGIFGAPNCLVGDELFWGEETLEDAVAWARR